MNGPSAYPEAMELAGACARGNSAAQKKLFMQLAPRMKAICLRYAPDSNMAQDFFQEGFIRLFSRIGSYKGHSSLETWSTRLFINNCLTLLKKDKTKNGIWQELDENIDVPEETLPDEANLLSEDEWIELMQSLPDGYRTVMNLYVFEEKSHKEIAEILGVSENTSKSQLFKARRMLRELLDKKLK